MGRASSQIVIFLLCLNAVGGVLAASGVAADLDIKPSVGGDEQVNDTEEAASQFDPSQGQTSTLFSALTSAAGAAGDMFTLVFYGPVMLSNVGLPLWMTTFPFAPALFIVAKDVLYVLTGRDT